MANRVVIVRTYALKSKKEQSEGRYDLANPNDAQRLFRHLGYCAGNRLGVQIFNQHDMSMADDLPSV